MSLFVSNVRPSIRSADCVLRQAVRSVHPGVGTIPVIKQGGYFAGVQPHPVKYIKIHDKLPTDSYGVQGGRDKQPRFGRCRTRMPIRMNLKKDKVYVWCSCGYSQRQPLCDGHHMHPKVPTNYMKPVRYIPEKDEQVWFCTCKQTKNRPFCDGSHTTAKGAKQIADEQTITVDIEMPTDMKL